MAAGAVGPTQPVIPMAAAVPVLRLVVPAPNQGLATIPRHRAVGLVVRELQVKTVTPNPAPCRLVLLPPVPTLFMPKLPAITTVTLPQPATAASVGFTGARRPIMAVIPKVGTRPIADNLLALTILTILPGATGPLATPRVRVSNAPAAPGVISEEPTAAPPAAFAMTAPVGPTAAAAAGF